MAWLRYKDLVEPSSPNPRVLGGLIALVLVSEIGGSAYDLWRDWQHHRTNWMHLGTLLVLLSLVALICRAARRASKKAREKRG